MGLHAAIGPTLQRLRSVLAARAGTFAARTWPGPPRRVWVGLAAVAAAAVAGTLMVLFAGGGAPIEPATPSAATVARGTVTVEVSAAGTLQTTQNRGLAFSMSSTVTELNVKAGDMVTAGQVLARIDDEQAREAVDSAQSRLDDAEEAVSRATAEATTSACPSTQVLPVALVAGSATAGPGGGTPTPSPEPSGGTAPPTGASPTGAAPTGSTPANDPAPATTCASARTSTTDGILSAEQRRNDAELALLLAERQLAGTVITAPMDGRVLSVGGTVGKGVSPGATAFIELVDMTQLAVRAQFSEADIGQLAVGQLASITLPDRNDPVSGVVSQIDPAGTADGQLVRYAALIAFDTAPEDVLLGLSATVTVTVASVSDVLYVPSAAVTAVTGSSGTVTVRVDGVAQQRTVRIGLRGDQHTQIVDGLAVGDEVTWGP